MRYGILAVVLISAAFVSSTAMAQDKKAAPTAAPAADAKGTENRKILIDNDRVLVSENTYKPGATSANRTRGVRVSRALTDATLERTYPDGRKETIQRKKGETWYADAQTYVQKNVGKSDYVVYTVTVKK